MKLWRCCVLGYLGGMLYTGLELLWRGWSHGSMFLAGGVCFLLIGHLGTVVQPLPVVWRGCVGAVIVTMVELAAGLLVNREYGVWDYRGVPGNFLGQICLPYTLLWIPVDIGKIRDHSPSLSGRGLIFSMLFGLPANAVGLSAKSSAASAFIAREDKKYSTRLLVYHMCCAKSCEF